MTNRFRKLPEIVLSFSSRFLRCLFHPVKGKKKGKSRINACLKITFVKPFVFWLTTVAWLMLMPVLFDRSKDGKKSRKANCDLGLWKNATWLSQNILLPQYNFRFSAVVTLHPLTTQVCLIRAVFHASLWLVKKSWKLLTNHKPPTVLPHMWTYFIRYWGYFATKPKTCEDNSHKFCVPKMKLTLKFLHQFAIILNHSIYSPITLIFTKFKFYKKWALIMVISLIIFNSSLCHQK